MKGIPIFWAHLTSDDMAGCFLCIVQATQLWFATCHKCACVAFISKIRNKSHLLLIAWSNYLLS